MHLVLDLGRVVLTYLSDDMHGAPSDFGVRVLIVAARQIHKLAQLVLVADVFGHFTQHDVRHEFVSPVVFLRKVRLDHVEEVRKNIVVPDRAYQSVDLLLAFLNGVLIGFFISTVVFKDGWI